MGTRCNRSRSTRSTVFVAKYDLFHKLANGGTNSYNSVASSERGIGIIRENAISPHTFELIDCYDDEEERKHTMESVHST